MVFYKILVPGKDIISILFVIVILTGTLVVSPTLTSIYSSESTSFANTSSQKKTEEPETFTISDKLKETIQSIVEKKNQTNAAIVIGLVDPNGTQFYGYGNLSNANHTPVDKDSIFAIASITKVFTTILLADMANRGLINLEDPIEKYLSPDVKVPTYNGQKITLENLATHTSGLSEFGTHCMNDFDGFDTNIQNRHFFIECSKNYTFDQLYQDLSNTTLTREPGSKYVYSTFGIGLLGHILALKAGMSYDDLLNERILNVLGMNSTSFSLSEVQKSRLAIGHLNGQELPSWNLSRPIEPGGGLFSSMSDMLKFASANLGLIDTKITNAMKDSHIIIKEVDSGPEVVYYHKTVTDYTPYVGLGWMIATDFGTQIVEKNGESIGGYNSLIALNPAKERGLVMIASTDVLDLGIAYYQYGAYDELSTLIWDLLTN